MTEQLLITCKITKYLENKKKKNQQKKKPSQNKRYVLNGFKSCYI